MVGYISLTFLITTIIFVSLGYFLYVKPQSEKLQDLFSIEGEITALKQEKNRLEKEIALAEADKKLSEKTRDDAFKLTAKELELEREKRKADFIVQLDKELEEIKEVHSLTNYQRLLEQLNFEIDKNRKNLEIIYKQEREAEEKEDFVKTHSLNLSDTEKSDISVLREFAPRLSNKVVLYKLIWSQFYQTKLQQLRKELSADKVTGIYKITNINSSKCYIGQAKDIGERFAEHVKCGLQINVAAPNKFYTAMIKEGPENFTFEILQSCEVSDLNEREKYWINFFNSTAYGYNTLAGKG